MLILKSLKSAFTKLFEKPKSSDYFKSEYIYQKEVEGPQIAVKQKVPKLYFRRFRIENFKGIKDVEVSFAKDQVALLLGLNESGKTTILKGIEAFDFRNDPDENTNPKYFTSIRRKSEVDYNGYSKISADLVLESKLPTKYLDQMESESDDDIKLLKDFIAEINSNKTITISRIFSFENGEPTNYHYQLESEHDFSNNELSIKVATEVVKLCPPIIYFEDFKDRIPEKIFANIESDAYDPIWYDVIDGLFYNAKSTYSIEKFKKYFEDDGARDDDAKTVLRQVNMELNKVFTKRWKSLSGVKQISDASLEYNSEKKYFELKIYDADGTNFSVEERSKGALWYLSFLMKTEFRSKKMRKDSGKPVYLIDEPASNLHSTAQTNMIKNFFRLAKDTSIIYTTHSQYLISLRSIKSTYVIKRDRKGTVSATKWSDFIKNEAPDVKYYQPLANLLDIAPFSLDFSWEKAIITEGPSDYHVLKMMHQVLTTKKPDYVIYPGTSASKLESLISLNMGWNAKFRVLLDSDEAGKKAGEKYKKEFDLSKEIVYLEGTNKKIESYINAEEKKKIYKIAFEKDATGSVTKKEFSSMIAIINEKEGAIAKVKKVISKETKDKFKELFEKLV